MSSRLITSSRRLAPGVGAVLCSWLGCRQTGGRPPVRHRTRDRPHRVRRLVRAASVCTPATSRRSRIRHRTRDRPSSAATRARRATTRNSQSQTINGGSGGYKYECGAQNHRSVSTRPTKGGLALFRLFLSYTYYNITNHTWYKILYWLLIVAVPLYKL